MKHYNKFISRLVIGIVLVTAPILRVGPFYQPVRAETHSTSYTTAAATSGIGLTSFRVDGSGNYYYGGTFTGTVDFDPSGSTDNKTSSSSGTVQSLYITKFNSSNAYQYTITLDKPSSSNTLVANDYGVDSSGNIYVVGEFSGALDFDPGAGTQTFDTGDTSIPNMFTLKLTTAGAYSWAVNVEEIGGTTPHGVAIDGSGNVYVGGAYSNTTDFDPGVGTDNRTPVGAPDVFITKYNSSGTYQWVASMGGSNTETGIDIAVDSSSNVYLMGLFSGTADFDPSGSTADQTSAGSTDIYIVKLNSSGAYQWANKAGDANSNNPFGVSVDSAGKAVLTGNGATGGYIIRFSTSGTPEVNITTIGGSSAVRPYKTTTDFTGAIYTIGAFSGTIDFDHGAGVVNLTSAGSNDIFITKHSSAGSLVWARRIGSSANDGSSSTDLGWGINVDSSRTLRFGMTLGAPATVDMDFDAGTANVTTTGFTATAFAIYSQTVATAITNLAGTLAAIDVGTETAATSESGSFSSGTRSIRIEDTLGNVIATVEEVNMNTDRNWSGVTAETNIEDGKSFIHNILSAAGVQSTDFTLYVPKLSGAEDVTVCPGATSLATVTEGCSSGVTLTEGTTGQYTVSSTNIGGQDYWEIEGATATGGFSGVPLSGPTLFTLVPNVSDSGDTQDVTVNFTANGEYDIGDEVAIDFYTGGDFTVTNCTSATTDADGDTTTDGSGVGQSIGGPNNDRFLYSFSAATTTASTTGIELCISVTAPNLAGNYRVDLIDTLGGFYSVIYYVGNENKLNITGTVDPILTLAIRNSTDTVDLANVGGGATGPSLCDLGNLLESGVQTCSYRLKVGTNASGYSVNIATDGNLRSGSAFIDNVTEDTTVTLGIEGYGIALSAGTATSGTITEAGIFNDDDSPIGSGTNTTLYSANGANSPAATDTDNTALVTHRAEADFATAAGTYTQLITYTVSATF